jgi:hypothetical protein
MTAPQCDMQADCPMRVTHIGEKGYIYCAGHAPQRRGIERVRRMRAFELALIRAGFALPSYKPLPRAETCTKIAENRARGAIWEMTQ